jgi:hypothetical protein
MNASAAKGTMEIAGQSCQVEPSIESPEEGCECRCENREERDSEEPRTKFRQ